MLCVQVARQVGRQSPVVPTSSAGAEVSGSRDFGAPRQHAEEAAVPATSRSSRGPQLGDSSWQNGPETTSKPRPSEWSSASDGAAFAKPFPGMLLCLLRKLILHKVALICPRSCVSKRRCTCKSKSHALTLLTRMIISCLVNAYCCR